MFLQSTVSFFLLSKHSSISRVRCLLFVVANKKTTWSHSSTGTCLMLSNKNQTETFAMVPWAQSIGSKYTVPHTLPSPSFVQGSGSTWHADPSPLCRRKFSWPRQCKKRETQVSLCHPMRPAAREHARQQTTSRVKVVCFYNARPSCEVRPRFRRASLLKKSVAHRRPTAFSRLARATFAHRAPTQISPSSPLQCLSTFIRRRRGFALCQRTIVVNRRERRSQLHRPWIARN